MNSPLPSGTKLDRYQIISQLGAGGMGEVYLAEDTRLHRKVALKILPTEVASHSDRMRRFTQEATAAASLNHPNIATIFETGAAEAESPEIVERGQISPSELSNREKLHFIAMEFIDGITLREKIHREPSDLRKLLRYLQQVAEGLAKAHAAGVVHRDLKPDNIMITSDGHAKVLDFGLVKLIEPALPTRGGEPGSSEVATAVMPHHSAPGTVLGTVGYMSPEQAQGKTTELDHRSDIFSFGCILFEAITGHKPFEGESVLKTLHMVAYEAAPAIKDFNPAAPADLQRIVRRCLAKDPEDRYQNIKDVAIELRDVRHELADAAGIDTTAAPSASSTSLGTQSESQKTLTGVSNTEPAARATQPSQSSAEYLVTGIKQHGKALAMGLALLLLVGSAAVVGWYKLGGKTKSEPFSSIKFNKLTDGGRVGNAVMDGSTSISRDGRYIVFSLNESGKISLWVRQIATNSNVQIVPAAEGANGGTTISPDSEFVFYFWTDKENGDGAIFQVPILGGTPRKILSDVSSPITFAPDGQRFAFVRNHRLQGDALVVANADGSGERTLVMRSGADWFSADGPAWSPDGKTIACSAGSDTGGTYMTVLGIDANTAAIATLTPHKWLGELHRVVWMNDGSGLIALGQTDFAIIGGNQMWFVPYPQGEVRQITNDLNNYGRVSLGLAADNKTIVTAQSDPSFQIWTIGLNQQTNTAQQISHGKVDGVAGLAWTPEGRIVYLNQGGDKSEFWVMNADGSDNRQLTSDGVAKKTPAVSPDGKYIFFDSMRTGISKVWRMNIDGSNAKQITFGGVADFDPTCSPDSQWITFLSYRTGVPTLWRVGIDGGDAVQLTHKPSRRASFSPDGQWLACGYFTEDSTPRWRVAIMPLSGGEPKTFVVTPDLNGPIGNSWAWAPDSHAIIYVAGQRGTLNLWSQQIDGGKPKQLTNFPDKFITDFGISKDGKHVALTRGDSILDVVLIKDAGK